MLHDVLAKYSWILLPHQAHLHRHSAGCHHGLYQQVLISSEQILRVAVIGAGLGGLALG